MTLIATTRQAIERRDRLKLWLELNAPDITDEQAHLDEGSRERIYWHYGYLIALQDVLKLMGAEETKQ